jgi:anti-sigma B factor antagonist
MRGFGLTIEPLAEGAVRVALRGELDLEHAYTFDEEMRRVEGARPPCLVLDLRGLSFLDSSGLARLLAANTRARRERRKLLLLVRGSAAVQRLLAITAVGHHFETVSEVPEELRAPTGLAGQAQ